MFIFFFFNDTATTEIYTLSLHDALPICAARRGAPALHQRVPDRHVALDAVGARALHFAVDIEQRRAVDVDHVAARDRDVVRSEEHTSELQSQSNLVCRLLLEKKTNMSDRRSAPAESTTLPSPSSPWASAPSSTRSTRVKLMTTSIRRPSSASSPEPHSAPTRS